MIIVCLQGDVIIIFTVVTSTCILSRLNNAFWLDRYTPVYTKMQHQVWKYIAGSKQT